jgi:hypothetical protein
LNLLFHSLAAVSVSLLYSWLSQETAQSGEENLAKAHQSMNLKFEAVANKNVVLGHESIEHRPCTIKPSSTD